MSSISFTRESAGKKISRKNLQVPFEEISCRPWKNSRQPRSVLFIRLHALGDVCITLPYIRNFKSQYPGCKADFLTLHENAGIPKSLALFSKVISLKGGRNSWLQLLHSMLLLPLLFMRRYEVVVDLQNNRKSRLIRKLLSPAAWSGFDRFSPQLAGTRTANTIEAAGIGKIELKTGFSLKNKDAGKNKLLINGWKGEKLIVLNPAGLHPTRNWPLENYIMLARLFLQQGENHYRFLMLGLDNMKTKAAHIKKELGNKLIDLTGMTTSAEAFSILQNAALVISEDSGLMHMAWISGIPTVAIFGSSRSEWSSPATVNSVTLGSADMECGGCMAESCKWGDNRCLTRYTPEFVYEKAMELIRPVEI